MTFKEHLKKYLTNNEIEELVHSFNDASKHAALINEKKMSNEKFLSLFPNCKNHPIVENAFIYDKNEYDLGKNIYHELGCFYLQEPSSMIVSSLLNFSSSDVVLDLCAAPGGKSIQAAFKMKENGIIYSNDISKERAYSIVENIERLGINNVVVTNNDFKGIYHLYKNYFTKIILDAPCSGSGMFRKDEKMVNDWSYNKVLKYASIQKELILEAYQMLMPGGIISYSTCSYSYEENEEVIEFLLKETDAEIINIKHIDNSFFVSKSNLGIHLLSSMFDGEGQYICQIKKPGEIIKALPKIKNNYQNIVPFRQNVEKYGDYLFSSSWPINNKKLSIIRNGMKIGEYRNDVIKYDLHYSRYISSFNQQIELNKKEVSDYLIGLTINKDSNFKGYVLLTYDNIPIVLAKTDGHIIKNNYPKGLRKNIKIN